MQYSFLDFLSLLGAVGLFLYGMKIMSEGLQKVAGDRMRNILSAMTKNRFAGLITGIFITALIQSSSASTVMVVSFVNAGLMSLADSMAVIMGANVGTTATTWIITAFGFKANIDAFVLPLIGLAIPFLFSKKSNYKSIAEFMIGFSFLFMGLQLINANVPDLKANPEMFSFLQGYSSMGFLSVLIFVFAGIVFTMIIQSSAAAFAIVMIMCGKGWITFDIACAMVLGSNIGTTITPILASLGANASAKKAAMGHFMFNFFGTLWTLCLFYPFVDLNAWFTQAFNLGDPNALFRYLENIETTNPALYEQVINGNGPEEILNEIVNLQFAVSFGLSIFHTSFNIVNVTVMIWLTNWFVKVTNFFIKTKHKEDEEFQLKFISSRMLSASELNITQAQQEIVVYAERVNRMFEMDKTLLHTKPETEEFNKLYSRIQKYEEISDRMEIEIANYLNKVVDGRLSYDGKMRIASMLNIVSEIESIADSCNNLARTMVRQHEAKVSLNDTNMENIETMFKYVSEAMENMLLIIRDMEIVNDNNIMKCYNKEREINNYRNALRSENVEHINQKLYSYEEGIYYMDLICESEKLGDYIVNVVEGVKTQSDKVHNQ